jgi:hypothetical protein
MDRLTEWEEVLTKMQGQLKGVEGKEADSLRKQTTALQDSIKAIRAYVSSTPNTSRQGIIRGAERTVMTTMQTAQQYIMAKSVAPGQQEQSLVASAEAMIAEAVRRINNFYDTRWTAYRRQVEGTKVNLFKDYTPIQ